MKSGENLRCEHNSTLPTAATAARALCCGYYRPL